MDPESVLNKMTVQVRAILVNIFGGIVDCSTIAKGIITACKEMTLSVPIVVRLEGKRETLRDGAIKRDGGREEKERDEEDLLGDGVAADLLSLYHIV